MYYIICGKYKKFKKPEISHFFKKLLFSIICSKCDNEDEKTFKEESIEVLKFPTLVENT